MRRLWSLLPILAGTLMIMLGVFANGNPTVFTDTDDYFVEGRTFAYTIGYALHLKTPAPPPTDPDDIADAKQAAEDLKMSHTEIGARSPYYGLLLYSTQRIGTIWFTAAVQGFFAAWLTFLFWRCAAPRAPRWTAYVTQAAVAFGSTLPFFAGFSMPDVFTGYTALAAILLLSFWDSLRTWERTAVAVFLGVAMTFHTSNFLNVLGLLVLTSLSLWLLKAPRKAVIAPLVTVFAALIGCIALNGAYAAGVKLKTGDELHRPPFLAMRVLADGPGRDYLRYACGHGVSYALCRYKDLPLDNSQDLLWSDDRKKGIFNVTTFDARLQMEKEEMRFVLGSVAYDPAGTVWVALENWAEQLSLYYVDDPLKNPHYYLTNDYWSTTNLPWLINHAKDCGRDHWGCGTLMTQDASEWFHGTMMILGLITIGVCLVGPRKLWRLTTRRLMFKEAWASYRRVGLPWEDDRTRLVLATGLLVAAVLINGFVCGALSGPFARYQARIVWLITLGAAVAMVSLVPARASLPVPVWVRRQLEHPLAQAVMTRVDPAFFRFFLVGGCGFIVDYAVLSLILNLHIGFIYWTARLISFPVAVAVTLFLNRAFTFKAPAHHSPWRQAALYVAVQVTGGAANYVVGGLAIKFIPLLNHARFVPLALGSAVGLCLTFAGSKYLAFKPAAAAPDLSIAPHTASIVSGEEAPDGLTKPPEAAA
jgi:putative flippase GtrA